MMDTLAERIRICVSRVGSGDELARRTGIPRRTLESYISGGSEPKAERALLIAEAADVDLYWLISGSGQICTSLGKTPPQTAGQSTARSAFPQKSALSHPLDYELLAEITRTIEQTHAEAGQPIESVPLVAASIETYCDIRDAATTPEGHHAAIRLMKTYLARTLAARSVPARPVALPPAGSSVESDVDPEAR